MKEFAPTPEDIMLKEALTNHAGTPMTEDQAYYLHNSVDAMVDVLIVNLEAERIETKLVSDFDRRQFR